MRKFPQLFSWSPRFENSSTPKTKKILVTKPLQARGVVGEGTILYIILAKQVDCVYNVMDENKTRAS